MSDVSRRRGRSFGGSGDDYQARPPYSDAALAKISRLAHEAFPGQELVGIDVGAGSGELSRGITGVRFTRVDPDARMLRRGQRLDRVLRPGTEVTPTICAEASELGSHFGPETAMVVTAGTTIHWWHTAQERQDISPSGITRLPVAALETCATVLRPNGLFVAAYQLYPDQIQDEITEIFFPGTSVTARGNTHVGQLKESWPGLTAAVPVFETAEHWDSFEPQAVEREAFGPWMKSFWEYLTATDADRPVFDQRIEDTAARLAGPDNQIHFVNQTTVFTARKRTERPAARR